MSWLLTDPRGSSDPTGHPVPPSAGGRLDGLDGLRALAVTMVVWHNFGALPGTARFGSLGELRAGYVGVTLFFVLSGFLIAHLLLGELEREGRVGLGAFYLRRAARLFPALVVALAILVGLDIGRHRPLHETFLALGSALGYFFNLVASRSNPLHPLGGDGWGHLWSLSVEGQFYVVFPALFVAGVRRLGNRRLGAVLMAGAVAITLWRTVLWRRGASFDRLYLLTDVRLDALLIGAALALALRVVPDHRDRARRLGWLLGPCLLTLVLLAHRGSVATTTASPGWLLGPGMLLASLVSVTAIWLVADGAGGLVRRPLESGLASTIGRRSYGIYLFHYPVLALVGDRAGGWFIAVALLAVVTELSYRVIETPALRLVPAWARRPAVHR